MTREELYKMIEKRPLILDGATGSNLQKAGMPTGVCPELWIMEHEEVLHRCSSLLLEKEKIGQAEFEELFDETVENSEKTEQNA